LTEILIDTSALTSLAHH